MLYPCCCEVDPHLLIAMFVFAAFIRSFVNRDLDFCFFTFLPTTPHFTRFVSIHKHCRINTDVFYLFSNVLALEKYQLQKCFKIDRHTVMNIPEMFFRSKNIRSSYRPFCIFFSSFSYLYV